MPEWLIILIAILCCVAICAFVYMGLVFRKIMIVTKKMDYLVEDLTYKSEKMNDVVSSVVKLSQYFEAAEYLIKNNTDTLSEAINKKVPKPKTKIDKTQNEKTQ